MSDEAGLLMTKCERKALFARDGKKVKDWIIANVADIPSENPPEVRCAYCHGVVRIHRKHVDHGPTDHVEHVSRQDSENCKGGFHFKGDHRLSLSPVE
ncbi:MAG: hypothetical protein H6Q00_1823 [Holophagaceae bacterium]|nr:hypothetical protein [Holophagaceae bacterium]